MEPKAAMIEWFDDHFYKIEYEENGLPVTQYLASVTTKLGVVAKPFLAKWRGDIGNREADLRMFEASQRGVRIHDAWFVLTTGGEVIYQPFKRPNFTPEQIETFETKNQGNVSILRHQDEMYDVFKLTCWLEAVKPEIVKSELITYSLKNRDAGTADNLFRIKKGKYLIAGAKALTLPKGLYIADLKTGHVVDDDAFMQTAAYAKNVEEMMGEKIVGTLIIHTGAATRTGIYGLTTLYRSKIEMERDYLDYRHAVALWERKNADAKPKVFEFPINLNYRMELKNAI